MTAGHGASEFTWDEGGEAAWVSSSDTALHGLAAIEYLALLGDEMP